MEMDDLSPKPLVWIGSTREDLKEFPEEVRGFMGHALYMAQCGLKHERAKPLKGFGSAGVSRLSGTSAAIPIVQSTRFGSRVACMGCMRSRRSRNAAVQLQG